MNLRQSKLCHAWRANDGSFYTIFGTAGVHPLEVAILWSRNEGPDKNAREFYNAYRGHRMNTDYTARKLAAAILNEQALLVAEGGDCDLLQQIRQSSNPTDTAKAMMASVQTARQTMREESILARKERQDNANTPQARTAVALLMSIPSQLAQLERNEQIEEQTLAAKAEKLRDAGLDTKQVAKLLPSISTGTSNTERMRLLELAAALQKYVRSGFAEADFPVGMLP